MRVSLKVANLLSSLMVLKEEKEQIVRWRRRTDSAQMTQAVSVRWRYKPIAVVHHVSFLLRYLVNTSILPGVCIFQRKDLPSKLMLTAQLRLAHNALTVHQLLA